MYPDTNIDFGDVVFAYTHIGRDDLVHVCYLDASPQRFPESLFVCRRWEICDQFR